jgi:hypothetical protein
MAVARPGSIAMLGPLALAALTGCLPFPAVAHGPRVQPGSAVGMSFSVPVADHPRPSKAPYLFGPLGVDYAYGWVGDANVPALQLGGEINLLPPRLDPDLYAQLPRRWLLGLDGGVGLAATTTFDGGAWMPYAQLGDLDRNGSGFYVTAGYIWPGGKPSTDMWMVPGQAVLSTLGYQRQLGTNVWRWFVTGMVRRPNPAYCPVEGTACGRSWGVTIGTSLQRLHPTFAGIPRRR